MCRHIVHCRNEQARMCYWVSTRYALEASPRQKIDPSLPLKHLSWVTQCQVNDHAMRAFEIYINGERLCFAGVSNASVFTAIIEYPRTR